MRRLIAGCLLFLFSLQLTGCMGWNQQTSALPAQWKFEAGEKYRLTLASGRVVEVTNVRVQHDSVFGTADSSKMVRGEFAHAPAPFAAPLAQITDVDHRAVSAPLTLGLFGAIVGISLLAGAALNSSLSGIGFGTLH